MFYQLKIRVVIPFVTVRVFVTQGLMGFKARILVKINLNYIVLHFRQISLMRYGEFDLYFSLP